jgi:Tol biopolymer transport system component/tRNA A-37 threonylcarbamoyl transferase component Bud32
MTPERWGRIKEVFQATLERAESERRAFLKQTCASDPGLRQEVDRLLREHRETTGLRSPMAPWDPSGRTISHYEILEKLGGGGMGVVYKARDIKLNRFVALKFLSHEISADEEYKRRFIHEAKAASALDHNNICTVHEVDETDDGRLFIAMGYYQGETLKKKIQRGPLPLAEALDYAVQIGQGLAKAHGKDIVHRDIKPANVIVIEDGVAKIVDFGLAQLGDATKLTKTGSTLGTPAYMSPEHVERRPIDRRADIWSLGVVLYEMICGLVPFKGQVEAAVAYSILHEEPQPLSGLRTGVPIELDRIVEKTLAKDPEERYRHVDELLVDLRSLLKRVREAGVTRRPPIPAAAVRRKQRLWYGGIAGLLIGLAVAIWFRGMGPASDPPGPPMTSVPFTSFPGNESSPAFSPDGNQVAFCWDGEKHDNMDIYVQLVGTGSPLRLTTHPDRDLSPAWSPDGRRIAFCRVSSHAMEVFAVPALGGPERKVADLAVGGFPFFGVFPDAWDAGGLIAWSPDGKWLAAIEGSQNSTPPAIVLLSMETGEKRTLTKPPPETSGDHAPSFSPNGDFLVFARRFSAWIDEIYLVSLAVEPSAGDQSRRLTFDRADVMGLDWTPDGRRLVFSSNRLGNIGLWSVPASGGQPEKLPLDGGMHPSLSRRGNRLAYVRASWDDNIWRIEGPLVRARTASGDKKSLSKLVASTRGELSPQFSPDGKKIVFDSDRSGTEEIWVCDSDGTNPSQLTFFGGPPVGSPTWSPDGRFIAFDSRKEGEADIYVIPAQGGTPRRLTPNSSYDARPSWSRDSRWIYFVSNRSGKNQIWKAPYEGGPARQVTDTDGRQAFESHDGKFVYYVKTGVSGVWRVPVEGGEERQILDRGSVGDWTVTPDGICFVDLDSERNASFQFYFFKTQRTEKVAVLPEEVRFARGGALAMSPDGRWLLYAQNDAFDSDIVLVENFR